MTAVDPLPPNLPSNLLDLSTLHTPTTFAFTPFLKAAYPDFTRPSKIDRPICTAYRAGHCDRGPACPDRHWPSHHQPGIRGLTCKHYLRGLCKKGDQCDFAHTYDVRAYPECKDWNRNWSCANGDDCMYEHLPIDSPSRLPACPHYARGFCPLGPHCGKRH
ncbi:Cleavage and polyadenylation specificity factor subunit 4, partial [Elasticomyces elasticus]